MLIIRPTWLISESTRSSLFETILYLTLREDELIFRRPPARRRAFHIVSQKRGNQKQLLVRSLLRGVVSALKASCSVFERMFEMWQEFERCVTSRLPAVAQPGRFIGPILFGVAAISLPPRTRQLVISTLSVQLSFCATPIKSHNFSHVTSYKP